MYDGFRGYLRFIMAPVRTILCVFIPIAAILLAPADGLAGGDPPDAEPDDRLPLKDRLLVNGLVERGMPELVEALLAKRPRMYRVHVARAYAKAALDEKTPDLREQLFAKGAKEYRRLIALEDNHRWLRGERRRFNVAHWRVEFGDMILSHWIAHDLDQFEITSGLEYDGDRLTTRLREAWECYTGAGKALRQLDIGRRTDEEHYLLLGIADRITELLARQELNGAWAAFYLAMIGAHDATERSRLIGDALGAFDQVSRSARDADRKYNALLGAGVALRELQRFDEAGAAFDRVLNSTAHEALSARANYEKARSLLQARRFDHARRELDRLALRRTPRRRDENLGALFYIRLAPLVHAYTYMVESQSSGLPEARRKELRQRARDELAELAEQGGSWPGIVQIYLDAVAGKKRGLDKLTDVELALSAKRLMSKQSYEEAMRAWRILLGRESATGKHREARFNLGVCLFQQHDLRSAAETFLVEARDRPPDNLADKVYEYAYRTWRQVAAESKAREDYVKLAEAAALLAEQRPDHRLAAEAGWVRALALDESGKYREALRAYGRVPRTSANYWFARRNRARCMQRSYEALFADEPSDRCEQAGRKAVEAWLKFAKALANAVEPARSDGKKKNKLDKSARDDPRKQPVPVPDDWRRWIEEAEWAAASILSGDVLREYDRCLELLKHLSPGPRVLGLQIRCVQGLGDIKRANRILEDYLAKDTDAEVGTVLVSLAAEMESQINGLKKAGRSRDAKQMAVETVPTIRHLLEWIGSQPEHRDHVPLVRFSLVKTLIQAEEYEEAATVLEELMSAHPNDGSYVRSAAMLQENMAKSVKPADREGVLDKAELLWAKLLRDRSLRNAAPARYWEARYHWLGHQLRHGLAAEVAKGIESEVAWYPDLGGPPWQGRLLELAARAREQMEAAAP